MSFAVLLDVVIVVLLVTAIGYALILNRRLSAFRDAKTEFEQIVLRFNMAAERAEAGVAALRASGDETGRILQQEIAKARQLREDLAHLVERAEPVVDRLASLMRNAAVTARATEQAVRAEPARAEAMPRAPIDPELIKTLASLR